MCHLIVTVVFWPRSETKPLPIPYKMLLIICVERLLHIGSHFSLRKWRRWPHFPTKLEAAASVFLKKNVFCFFKKKTSFF